MRGFTAAISFTCLLALGACGGSTDPVSREMTRGGAPGSLLFSNALSLQSQQLAIANPTQVGTFSQFNDYNSRPVAAPPTGAAKFDGGLVAQIGNKDEFIGGGFSVILDMVNGTGSGTVGFIDMAGHPTIPDGLLDTSTRLSVNVTNVSGSNLTGTINGVFSDQIAFDRQFSEEFQVDATFDARFVNGDFSNALVGVVNGTIDPESAPIENLTGVIEATQDPIF